MPARRDYMFLYQQCVRNVDEETKLKIDALLGDPAAAAELQRGRMAMAAEAEWEVG